MSNPASLSFSDFSPASIRAVVVRLAYRIYSLRQGCVSRKSLAFPCLCLLLLFVLILSLALGAFPIRPLAVISVLGSQIGLDLPWSFSETEAVVIWHVRAPRVLFGSLSGGGLALGGALMQALFRNPLADPGLIGISAGSAVGAALVTVFGSAMFAFNDSVQMAALPIAAFVGGLLTTGLVFRLSNMAGRVQVDHMLLVGIAVNALAGAAIGVLMLIANDAQLRELAFWSFGSLGRSTWPAVFIMGGLMLPVLMAVPRLTSALNAFLLGESEASHLGVNVDRLKFTAVALTCLAVAGAVAFAGVISFVGLVVPHIVRLICGPDHRILLPASALLGASMLPLADLLARTAAAPIELPIGLVTSLLGAPLFLWLLVQSRDRRAI